ncbi:NAD(P)H-dependent oxidoreductase [Tsukamurella sp. 8F]|uniref:NADPH-dependent FMN reductase n=1 Tax=unclassified Tsukamurella TaxID=2633480 RepID=UPI0023B89F4F|nr:MULTISPECIES: NADPH-dependent FMN reductase [unclassified Tsukamurella]MDF0529719.1 NAD(P)H-dependent oxidoreductase [Tsukamurella sp. 8J]MDF0586004.1 NAD(P)H-dependent oxidoreductase [Tsukamurella sp. 8F]
MSETKKVLAVVGSLRRESLNRELALAAQQAAPEGVEVVLAEGIADVPFYNEDIDGEGAPAAAADLRRQIADADAVLFVAPPNNGTISAVQKNVIDWASRPYGESSLSGKPSGIVGVGHRLDTTFSDAERSITIAGGVVPDGAKVEFLISSLEGKSPRESAAVAAPLRALLETLVAGELQSA